MPKSGQQLPRVLGRMDGLALLAGITIGAGIYSTPQRIAGYLPSYAEIVPLWIIAGIFVIIGGLIYAELGTRFPQAGGEYVYLREAFGPATAFVFGWAQLFIIRTSPAAGLAIITVDYLTWFVPLTALAHTLCCIAIILALAALNYIGMARASLWQKISTLIKVGGLLFLAIAGIIAAQGQANLLGTELVPSQMSGWGGIAAAMMLVVFSYLGWDRVGYVAEEMRQPRRDLPFSLIYGILLVMVVYVLAVTVYHQVLGMEAVRGSKVVAAAAAEKLFGPVGAGFIAITVMISASGSINGTMMSAPRVYFAMARDKLFFSWLNYVHPRFGTPSRAVLVHAVWAIVILLVRQNFEQIVAGMTFALLLFYSATTVALFKFRRRDMGAADSFRVPAYPLLPAIFLAGIVLLICLRAAYFPVQSLADLAFVAVGIPAGIYWLRKR